MKRNLLKQWKRNISLPWLCASARRAAERALTREMNTPPAAQDALLIEECLLNIEEAGRTLDALAAHRAARERRNRAWARRGLAVCASVALTVLLVSLVAQAFGFRIWRTVLSGDPRYISLSDAPMELTEEEYITIHLIGQDDPAYGEDVVYEHSKDIVAGGAYGSYDEAIAALGFAPLPLPLPEGFYLVSITDNAPEGGNAVTFLCLRDGNYIRYTIRAIPAGETAWVFVNEGAGEFLTHKGKTYRIETTGGAYTVSWEHGGLVYELYTNLAYETVVELLKNM
ncbi:MAG: DUF4367 domain-containing protein [Clostridiales bacterium]|nr:DUF4367 domain-containing protein [Clostridiales bacterium]